MASCWFRRNLWNGKVLSEFVERRYGIGLGVVGQCQRLFRQLGFRLRKPRRVIAGADPERQREHKRTRNADGRCVG
ncbi:winged helix-turn-helix domain-containing protein [uncultured Paludibaculum sp.]|uniref:winged helix-turn-helix domain-containing protein n=1 Tax=uncultured Paludibaculum sp. TaxID=1765020 RepID=UPI00374DAF79